MRTIRKIIVHCSATPPEWGRGLSVSEIADQIRGWHLKRGWSDIGYHFVIGRDGKITKGRPVDIQGAHVKGQNADSIGVCLVGGKDSRAHHEFHQHFTPQQRAQGLVLLAELAESYMPNLKVFGHNDFTDKKACPGI